MKWFWLFFIRSYHGNIPKFFVFYALYNLMFFMPVWVIFLQERHALSLTQVTLVDFAFWITMALTEVPTGAVADTLGRKPSMLIGLLLAVGSVLLFGLAPTYSLLLLANSLWGIAITFISGADMAFFYDTLQEVGLESDYPRLRGHLSAVGLVAVGASSVLGGLLATWQFSSPFLFYAGALVAAGLVVLMLKEPPGLASADGGKRLRYADILQGTFNAIRKIPALGYVLAYSNVLPLAGAAILITFIQPHAIAIGVPLASLGILSFGLTLFRILGSMRSGRFVRRFGEWRSLVMGAVLVVTGVFGLGAFPSMVGVGLFALAAYASAATRPLIEDLLLRQVPATIRATILSVDNLIFRVLLAFLELGAGIAADVYGLPAAFMLMAVVVGFILYFLLASWRRIWGKEIGPAGPDLVSA
jgi:MFS family permease